MTKEDSYTYIYILLYCTILHYISYYNTVVLVFTTTTVAVRESAGAMEVVVTRRRPARWRRTAATDGCSPRARSAWFSS